MTLLFYIMVYLCIVCFEPVHSFEVTLEFLPSVMKSSYLYSIIGKF